MDTSLSTLSLAGALLTSVYLIHLIATPPNPEPANPYAKDSIKSFTKKPRRSYVLQWATWLWQIALILFPNHRSKICYNADLLNLDLMRWSLITVITIGVVLIAAPIRLLAYAQLGKNFTFQLAKPSGLVTTGLYKYCQHPSYTTLYLVMAANGLYILRADGISACMLPRFIARFLVGIPYFSEVVWCGFVAAIFVIGRMRIRDEEEMMRKEFGQEWEEYHRKTKRFIPWVI